jgi:sarcosine oxidase gamma subunit
MRTWTNILPFGIIKHIAVKWSPNKVRLVFGGTFGGEPHSEPVLIYELGPGEWYVKSERASLEQKKQAAQHLIDYIDERLEELPK